MSSVKALPVGHVNTSPMYVITDSSLGHKKNIHWPPPHESQPKRPTHQSFSSTGGGGGSHPGALGSLSGTRGYPYPQDPTSRIIPTSTPSYSTPSPHLVHPGGGTTIYTHANHVYRETHFQVENRPPSDSHNLDRYGDHNVHNARRRLSLRPPDYNNSVMDRDRPSPHDNQTKRPFHQPFPPPGGGGNHPSPPLAGTRGYPYPQDPNSRCTPSSTSYSNPSTHLVHPAGVGTIYAPANHVYRETHLQVENRPPSDSHLDRYGDHNVHNRRRLSLRPPDYNAVVERERYMEAFRYTYEPISVPYSTTAMAVRTLKPPVVSVHTPSDMDVGQPIKRPRLAVEPKAPVHQPLLIDTRNVVIKKEAAYTPQVEAISPTLPSEEGRCDSPMRLLKENILNNIRLPEKENTQVDAQVCKIQKKELEELETKPSTVKEAGKELTNLQAAYEHKSCLIYSENRVKAQESHSILEKLGPVVEIPMYNQPSDTAVYHENKRRFLIFKSRLMKSLRIRQKERELRVKHLTETYSKLQQEWLKKLEKKENNTAKKAKDLKLREFFEKQFPELKKQREDKERISRVSQRIRSDAEWEEIIDGLQEQELEEKKMRSYAVIPPILLDKQDRKVCYVNKNGLLNDMKEAYEEKQLFNIWTEEEKEVFKEKYLQHPKNFAFIASCLQNKSVADCVQYYYVSKKSENYKQLLRKHSVRKRTRGLVKPTPQQQSSSTGVTTRQQEEAKATGGLTVVTSNMQPQVSTQCNTVSTATVTNTTSAISSPTTSTISANSMDVSSSAPMDTETSSVKSEPSTVSSCEPASVSNEQLSVPSYEPSNVSSYEPSNVSSYEPSNIKYEPSNIKYELPSVSYEPSSVSFGQPSVTSSGVPNASCGPPNVAPYGPPNVTCEQSAQAKDIEKDLKVQLPNNIRIKKEADTKEGSRSDSDTASDNLNGNTALQPCAVCKLQIDNLNQSRPLTNQNCSLFGLKESDLIGDMKVCASCRFKSVRKRCPLPTCSTPRRKVKRLRPLARKLSELPKETRDAFITEFQIPADVNKCCSACFNRIIRKMENNGSPDSEPSENSRWTEEEKEKIKQGLRQNGCNWEAIATLVETKNKEQCRNFYFNYKRKFGLEEILQEYKKNNVDQDGNLSDGKPPPMVTDEEESGETTSSCDEDDRADRCSSDTASAPSPVDKILNDDKNEILRPPEIVSQPNQNMPIPTEEFRVRSNSLLEASPKCPPDYDSSATVSADEGQNNADGDGRDSSPRVVHSTTHGPMKVPAVYEHRKPFQSPLPLSKEIEVRPPETSIPIVKTLLQDPKIGAAQSDSTSYIKPGKPGKDEPTCVRDLIYQAIEMSLQYPAKTGRNSSPIPSSVPLILGKETTEIAIIDIKKEIEISTPFPPTAHGGSRHPSRPGSHHMDIPPDCEVQDLSKKVKSRDVSPVKDFIKRERVVTPVRPPSGSSSNVHYYGAPPPAHCNTFRSSQPPPPALSPHYVADPHHDTFYPRGGDSRGKTYVTAERPHSQPPHLVAQSSSLAPSVPTHAKPLPVKATVPPPPPLVASKPSQMSPKMPYKERLVSMPPTGSITQGTPVNQQSVPVPPTNLPPTRYEGFLRQLPPHQTKDGSITLGTPVQHDSVKRLPPGRPEVYAQLPDGLVRQAVPALYDPSVIEYYRQVAPNTQSYAFPPGYAPYPANVVQQRPPYANESQLSSKQIMIDFNTSKQMQLRRSGNGQPDKEIKVSPRGSDNSSGNIVPQENHLHPMYPPANYQTSSPQHYNNVPPGYQAVDTRYLHHRSPNSQIDRTRSPSGVESPNYSQMPGKHSPNLAMSAGRQNVIHRSITWGTGKPSVIQVPQSASPRASDMRNEAVSPASVRKSAASPRQSQPLLYPSVPPSGHDAFNTLVNAAVAQPSLAVPKDGKGSPSSVHMRQDSKSPRDRPVVEGLEKTLIDMHQRPRSYTDSSHNVVSHERLRNENSSDQSQPPNDSRYSSSTQSSFEMSREHHRLSDKQMLITEQASSLRLGNMREPFSREQFERQMRQTTGVSLPRDRSYDKKEERSRTTAPDIQSSNYPPHSQQSDLDNEASKIFSQSFQKDAPRSNASPRGFTAANLIDAIITRQINQNVEAPTSKSSSVDLFNQYNASYDGTKTPPKSKTRTEVVTIDDEPDNEKNVSTWSERPNSHGRSPPVPPNSSHGSTSGIPVGYAGEKVYTLSEHIAAIISKDYNSSSEAQPLYSNSQSSTNTSVSSSRSSSYGGGSQNSNKQLEGIAAALPPDVMVNSNVAHSLSDNSWKLRRALQQDREREHRAAMNELAHKRPSSNQSSDAASSQEERQIIRVAQTSSPSSQNSGRVTPAVGPYAVEPISPPSQVSENNESNSRNSASQNNTHVPAWANNPSITGLLTTRYVQQDYSDSLATSIVSHYPLPSSGSNPAGTSGRPPHQQQMGLSPLDYVKNRIVEVMRTATDDEPESSESRRPQSAMSSHSEEREHQLQQMYRLQQNPEIPAERPCSTGNGPPLLQGQRYSPAVSRYSPVPPRPSSAAERVPSRNSTPGEVSRQHKRSYEGHLVGTEWREGQNVSRGSSRSVSPSIDNLESNRKKTRSEGTFIPESTTDRAPVLLPQNSINVHRSGSISEAPRLSSSNQSAQVMDSQSASKGVASPRTENYFQHSQTDSDSYKYRVSDSRPETQWGMVNNHNHIRTSDTEPLGRHSESMNIGAASSTTVESYSPSSRNDIPSSKNLERGDSGTRNSPVTSSGVGSQEPNRNSPSASSQGQRSASSNPIGASASPSSGHYSPFGAPNGNVSSSTSTLYSSAASLPLHTKSHIAYSSFSGMGTTIAYPFSALSMRSLTATSSTLNSTLVTNSSPSVTSSRISPMPVTSSPSPLSRNNNNQPPALTQYEPLSDED